MSTQPAMPDNTFVLFPAHRGFVFGGAYPPDQRTRIRVLVAVGLGIVGAGGLILAILGLREVQAGRPLLGLRPDPPLSSGALSLGLIGLAVLFLVLLLLGLRQLRRLWLGRRLRRRGYLLQGEVRECTGQAVNPARRPGYYRVTVRYLFYSPITGLPVVSTADCPRDDLRDQPLPEKGTPLAVLYLADQNYRLM